MERTLRTVAGLVVAAALLASCGGNGSDDLSRCESVDPELVTGLADSITVDGGGTLRGAQRVRSEDFEKVWFVAADIQSAGMNGKDDIAVWASDIDGGTGIMVFSVNEVAKEFSDFGDSTARGFDLDMSDDGADEVMACVKAALS